MNQPCQWQNEIDGTCDHPDAVTPECHRWSDCPVVFNGEVDKCEST